MIDIAKIRTDGGTQPRDSINPSVVDDYTEAMVSGATFPPVTVFYDGEKYWLSDGFHRVSAARKAGLDSINAEVKQGTRREAILHSVGANADHGLRRTNADKRRAVMVLLNDNEWAQWSDRHIARICAVSQPFVSSLRGELSDNGYQIETPTARKVERNGTTYTQNTTNIGRRPEATENPEDTESPEDPEAEPKDEYIFDEWSDDGSDDGSDDEEADDHNNRPRGEDADNRSNQDTTGQRIRRPWRERADDVIHDVNSENASEPPLRETLSLSSASEVVTIIELEWREGTRALSATACHEAANKLLVFFRDQAHELNRMAAS